jgi:soluble cytochrome b562
MLTEYIYALWHFKIGAEDERDVDDMAQSAKDIGFYTTEEKATAAIQRLRDQPEFRDWPEGFRVFRTPLDLDRWADGFVSWDDA